MANTYDPNDLVIEEAPPSPFEDTMQTNEEIYTPKKSSASSSEIYPNCEEEIMPKTGMIFNSLTEGIDFYKAYAHCAGFSVRLSSETKKDGIVHWKYLVCSKEGWHKDKDPESLEMKVQLQLSDHTIEKNENKPKAKRRRSLTREGCKAICVLKRASDGKYEILRVHEGHSHALATPSKQHMLKSARKVQPVLKTVLRACHRSNVGTSKAFCMVKQQYGGSGNVGCMRRDLQNFHRDIKSLLKNSDAQMFLDNFRKMKEKSPSFYFAYEIDKEHRLKHVFWADGICRKNYALFGDAISFDTTYGTNKYSMIFAPFTGMNHHRQSISFGAAFLANEQADSFECYFRNF